MQVIGGGYRRSYFQVTMLGESTGDVIGRKLSRPAEAEAFCRSLRRSVRDWMEASGNSHWFERYRTISSGSALGGASAATILTR